MNIVKRLLSVLPLLLLPIVAWGQDTIHVNGYNVEIYKTDYTAKVVSGGEPIFNNITIPESVYWNGDNYTVVSIEDGAFENCTVLQNITVSGNVKSIGANAFKNCTNLKTATIGNSVESIGESAFNGCSAMESVTLSNAITTISNHTFNGCSSLQSVVIPDGVTSIGSYAFYYCNSLESVTLGSGIKNIKEYSFYLCRALKSVVIPDSVTSIGSYAFATCSVLESVSMGNSVKTIGNDAFDNCGKLKNLTLSDSLTTIGDWAFYACSTLPRIVLPSTVTTIGNSAFLGCEEAACISLPASLREIEESAFHNCTSVDTLILGWEKPDSCTYGTDMLKYVPTGAKLYVPKGSAYLYQSTSPWSNFSNIEEIVFNGDVIVGDLKYTINSNNYTAVVAQQNPPDISGSMTIPETFKYFGRKYTVTGIGEWAFLDCTNLTNISIPSTVTTIEEGAFNYCQKLAAITLPNAVTTIGDNAFKNCEVLTSLTIPASVKSIGFNAFNYCYALESIAVETGNTVYDSREDCNAIIVTATDSLILGCKNTVIPNGVTHIGDYAFICSNLTGISIPNSVLTIGANAFENCSQLTTITLPESVTTIGKSAFLGSGLTSISLPNTLTSIGASAFSLCANLGNIDIPSSVKNISREAFSLCSYLTSVTIPESVDSIGDGAFEGCFSLVNITLGWDDPTVCAYGTNIFNNANLEAYLYVPDGAVKYSTTYPWSDFTSVITYQTDGEVTVDDFNYILNSSNHTAAVAQQTSQNISGHVTIPETIRYNAKTYRVTSIGSNAFRTYTSITGFTFPDSISSFGNNAFDGCSNLESITIPQTVKSLGDFVFQNCSKLTSVSIPDSVTSVGIGAFHGCTKLESVTMPEDLETIPDSMFTSCSALKTINIPDSATTIGKYAFMYCTKLATINFGSSLTTLEQSAFEGCTALTSLNIPSPITTIGVNAVARCTNLASLTLANSVKTIGEFAFTSCDSLRTIVIPSSVDIIEAGAFYFCSHLTSVLIPSSVVSIGDYAFSDCTALDSISLSWADPTVCAYGSNIVKSVPTTATLFVPQDTKVIYQNTDPWSQFSNIYCVPGAGFYRIKGESSGMYLSNGTSTSGGFNMSTATDATTIFYYDGTHLTNYSTGLANGMTLSTAAWVYGEDNASTVVIDFGQSSSTYSIATADAFFYDNGDVSSNATASSTNNGDARLNSWTLEEVTSLPFNISSAGQATICLPVAFEIPTNVAVRYATSARNGGLAMAECGGSGANDVADITAVPANTPVILAGTAGSYTLNLTTTTDTIIGDILTGTGNCGVSVETSKHAYILALNGQNQVVFALLADSDRNIAAFKSYFILDSSGSAPQYLYFSDDEVTGINAVNTAIQQGEAVYDLQGRRVNKATNGVYIVNGKKVMVR